MSWLSREPCSTPNWASNHGPWYELTEFLHTVCEKAGKNNQEIIINPCHVMADLEEAQDQPLLLYRIRFVREIDL